MGPKLVKVKRKLDPKHIWVNKITSLNKIQCRRWVAGWLGGWLGLPVIIVPLRGLSCKQRFSAELKDFKIDRVWQFL